MSRQKLKDGQHRPRPPRGEEFRFTDEGEADGFIKFQCLCGCKPMDLAIALVNKGMWPFDCSVVDWDGRPALRCRVEMD